MDGLGRRCPDDITLESYLYEDLPFFRRTRIRLHLMFCPACRKRLVELREFSEMLSKVPPMEMPDGFVDDLVKSIDTWGDPTPVAPADEDEQVVVHGPSLKLRWALGAVLFAVSSFLQWQYGDYLPGYLSSSYLSGLRSLGQVWEYVSSGAFARNIALVIEAFKTDGISALEILGTSIPTQIAGVIVFGGIVTAVFVSQLKVSRNRREGHHR